MIKYISIVILIILALCNVGCSLTLWKRRGETEGRSRTILSMSCLAFVFFASLLIFRTLNNSAPADSNYLNPNDIFGPALLQLAFFIYPLETLRLKKCSKTKFYIILFAPLLLMSLIGLFGGIEYTTLKAGEDIRANISRPDVLFRFATLILFLCYGFALLAIPYDKDKYPSYGRFITTYTLGMALIGTMFFLLQITHSDVLSLLNQIIWGAFFIKITSYELRLRPSVLVPLAEETQTETMEDIAEAGQELLWNKIIKIIEEEEGWRKPEMSLPFLTSAVLSNRTYVEDAFKRNCGMSFRKYLSKRRVEYVVQELRRNPEANVQELFYQVGIQSRSTASETFKRVMGMTITEFITSLKAKHL